MLPDSLHPEVRFVCQHSHCKDLNSHQHLALLVWSRNIIAFPQIVTAPVAWLR